MSSLVRIVSETEPLPSIPEGGYVLNTGFEPDRFQKFAIEAIEAGHNVLVTAKTGSGKTFVGEYQIAKSLSRGGRIFYTTPIKSLSNQKFHDLKKLFPEATVGIMTGDIKFCPDAQILVMTTEILRNLLFKQGTATEKVGLTSVLSLEGLDSVIFDEVHYINDPDRGHVWEETLMLLPPTVKIILLSATLSKPQVFANWLAESKQVPLVLISTQWRAVPLFHYVTSLDGKLITMQDHKEVFQTEAYRDWLAARKGQQFAADKYKEKVHDARRAGTEGAISGKVHMKSFEHQLNELLDSLSLAGNLPAIVFQFSRKGCERLAGLVRENYITAEQGSAVKHIWDFHLSRFRASLETSSQYHALLSLVQRGIAFHHSGLQPFLKEILEILFNKGLIKVLFATETFAVGLNMPTKTVIFTALEKYVEGGIRVLTTAEYIQMAGRAGRRGKDDRGLVIYLPQKAPLELYEAKSLLQGQAATFCSRISFHYDFVLKVCNLSAGGSAELVQKSYWWNLEKQAEADCHEEVRLLRLEMAAVQLTPAQRIACESKEDIEYRIATNQNSKKKAAQRELERWKDEHRESAWAPALQRFARYRDLEVQCGRWERECSKFAELDPGHIPVVERRMQFLKECGYMEEDEQLTMKGRMASEVSEGHPFLMTELFLRWLSTSELPSCEALLSVLSLFLGEGKAEIAEHALSIKELTIEDTVREELLRIEEDAKTFSKQEQKGGIDDPHFWQLSTEWVEPMTLWVNAEEETLATIAKRFGVFEGNVQKAVMKLANLVEEVQSLATLAGAVELLRQLETAREKLLRGLVIAESLYLRL
jgi:superfamily II RNA helicase